MLIPALTSQEDVPLQLDVRTRRVRVLLIVTSLCSGGAERQVIELAIGLTRRGYSAAIMSLRSDGPLKRRVREAAIPLYELGMPAGKPTLGGLLRAVRAVRQFRPSVIHSHMYHANILARVLRTIVPAPVLICTAHNSNEGGGLRMMAYRLSHRLASCTTNVSSVAARELERRGAAPRGSLLTVPNGIDTEIFRRRATARDELRAELGIAAQHFVFLSVGRLTPQKDYTSLLVAVRQLVATTPRVRLLVAGSGELEHGLKGETERLALNDHVRWLGERDDVPRLMNAADAFVLSSAYEGFGLVVGEAMATELPVIATACFGPEEVIGDTGYIVPLGDASELARAMFAVINLSSSDRERLGKRARQRVLEMYSLDAALTRWQALYAQLLHESRMLQ